MSFDLGLTGGRALVTGGTKGIGAAVALALRDAGAKVIATARALPGRPFKVCSISPPISRPPKEQARLHMRR